MQICFSSFESDSYWGVFTKKEEQRFRPTAYVNLGNAYSVFWYPPSIHKESQVPASYAVALGYGHQAAIYDYITIGSAYSSPDVLRSIMKSRLTTKVGIDDRSKRVRQVAARYPRTNQSENSEKAWSPKLEEKFSTQQTEFPRKDSLNFRVSIEDRSTKPYFCEAWAFPDKNVQADTDTFTTS